MIFVVISIILGLLAFATFIGDGWAEGLGAVAIVMVPSLVLGLITGMVFGWQPTEPDNTVTPLVNLQDGSGVYGRFVLGTGTIGEYPAYYYYTSVGQDQYVYKNLVADPHSKPIIVFTDEKKNPYLKELTECEKPKGSFWWIAPFWYSCETIQYEFHIPKGTIKQNFELDAK